MDSFSTKADTLKQLEGNLINGKVLPQVTLNVAQEINLSVARDIISKLATDFLIVRSSSISEDSEFETKAGQYLSIANVQGEVALINAINDVKASFDNDNENNQIFIQPMLIDVELCGVLFTRDPSNGSNYYIINYDKSGSTSSVTSGYGETLETLYVYKERPYNCCNSVLNKVIMLAKELEEKFNYDKLDIEFAIKKENVYLLQVRRLIINQEDINVKSQTDMLNDTYLFIKKNMRSIPYLHGKKTIYTIMSDWNPAEMIGLRPRPLASSLYKKLITDGTWAYQRNNYGYKNLRSFPLMIDLFGLTYIDTRVSFNSFIPADINNELSEKLVNYYLRCLEENSDKQDKIEFEIVYSCFYFGIEDNITILQNNGFTEEELNCLKTSLLNLTNRIINIKNGLWKAEKRKIKILEERRKEIMESDLDTISKIYWLLEDCARYGTLPFAGLARAGFIAIQLLKSLVNIGIIKQSEYEGYMQELNTISSSMLQDNKNLSQEGFISKYAHLRPDTYNILSKRYDEASELYFKNVSISNSETENAHKRKGFKLSLAQYKQIQDKMKEYNLDGDVLNLFEFIKEGIEGREYAKFVFTHSVSEALNLLKDLGREYGFSADDISYFNIYKMLTLYNSACDVKDLLERSIIQGKLNYKKSCALSLPPVIYDANQVYSFYLPNTVPNYITLSRAEGTIINQNITSDTIKDKILLIQAADPGYDWIFAHNIRGFVTAFGGANSHMAIRAGELNIPAVIGVGQKTFENLCKHENIIIDCANKKIEVLR